MDLSDDVFKDKGTLIVKGSNVDRTIKAETGSIVSSSTQKDGSSTVVVQKIISDILVLNVESSEEELSLDGTYTTTPVAVSNLTKPFTFTLATDAMKDSANVQNATYK